MYLAHRYLVRLVIILGIVFEHFRFLFVVEVPDEVVDTEFLPPFFAVNEPAIPVSREHLSSGI